MQIALVVAVAENGVIGRDGGLPWRFKADLRRFRAITMGKPLVMGRATFESIGRPLDGRDTIVLSGRADFRPAGVTVVRDLPSALDAARSFALERGAVEICVIGGAGVFSEALAFADRLYVTHVDGEPAGDARFSFPAEDWRPVSSERLPAAPGDDAAGRMVVYERR